MMNTPPNKTLAALALAATAIGLTGCGGGSSSSTPATGAEGVYAGTLTSGTVNSFQLLVLENGEYWAMYGSSLASSFLVSGFAQGQGASNNGAFTSSDLKDFGASPPLSGTLSASYVAGTRISGTITESSRGSATFSGTPLVSANYDYNAAASVAPVVGAWNLTALDGTAVAMTINANGTFTGTSVGCSFSGTLTPRPSGKNVLNVALTFGAAPCALPNTTGTGIALSYLLNGGPTRELLIAGVNGARTAGIAAVGRR